MTINVSYQFGFLRCLLGFVWGMLVYLAYLEQRGKSWLGNGWVFLMLLIGLFFSMHLALPDVVTVLFFPFILLSAAFGNAQIDHFLNSRPLQKLGDWSFSIYLVHQPLIILLYNVFIFF